MSCSKQRNVFSAKSGQGGERARTPYDSGQGPAGEAAEDREGVDWTRAGYRALGIRARQTRRLLRRLKETAPKRSYTSCVAALQSQDRRKTTRRDRTHVVGRSLSRFWSTHSPQAKGRVQRSFPTAQDRLVKARRGRDDPRRGQASTSTVSSYTGKSARRGAACESVGPLPVARQDFRSECDLCVVETDR